MPYGGYTTLSTKYPAAADIADRLAQFVLLPLWASPDRVWPEEEEQAGCVARALERFLLSPLM